MKILFHNIYIGLLKRVVESAQELSRYDLLYCNDNTVSYKLLTLKYYINNLNLEVFVALLPKKWKQEFFCE